MLLHENLIIFKNQFYIIMHFTAKQHNLTRFIDFIVNYFKFFCSLKIY
jgi:hypothetical protein